MSLPGHGTKVQLTLWRELPVQFAPPYIGSGSVHVRCRSVMAKPQSGHSGLHADQLDHPPSTAFIAQFSYMIHIYIYLLCYRTQSTHKKRKSAQKEKKKNINYQHVHRPSINTLTSLTEKLSKQNAPDLMNNNSNNICAHTASSGLTTLQQYRWIYWWLNNINRSYWKSYLEQQRNMLQPSGDFIRPCHTAYLTMKFTNWLSQIKHFCVSEQTFHQFIIQRQTTAQ